jgi:GNAT superfamily N-acetyltransferase
MDALPSGYAARSLTPADLDQVYAVYAADELANAGELSIEREDIDSDWSRPSFDLAADAIAVTHAGAIVAAGEIARHGNRAEAAVHPDHQGRGIGQWLESWLADRAVRQGASSIAQIAPQGSTKDRFLIDSGYALAHTSWVLQLPEGAAIPDRPLPPGYALRTATGDDIAAAYEVVQRAFGEWEGRARESYEDWRATIVDRPGTQPWQLRVITQGGHVVGTAFTILDTWKNGYVQQLAVEREHRGRGLAQILLADAFSGARARGAATSELSTDSRTGALGLYEKVGMVVRQTWVNRRRELTPPR